jgi:hypothetical protein
VTDRLNIPAIHERDSEDLLEQLGLKTQIESGSLRCRFCGATLTWTNLGALYYSEGAWRLCCSGHACMWRAAKPSEAGTA